MTCSNGHHGTKVQFYTSPHQHYKCCSLKYRHHTDCAVLQPNTSAPGDPCQVSYPRWHTMKEICRACNYLPVHFFFQKQWDQQALWIFNQKVEKLSAMRHHLLQPSWPSFLSSPAMPDKPLEGLSACGNGWAILQRTRGVR